MYKYIVSLAGGYGPNVWDSEIEVEAENIAEALNKVIKEMKEDEYSTLEVENIISIEQAD